MRIAVPARFVVASRDAVRARVREALDLGAPEIQLDFRETIDVDTVALGMLITLVRLAEERGVIVSLWHVGEALWPAFEMHRLGTRFSFRP